MPYITGHSVEVDASILWVNPSQTWVDIGNTSSNHEGKDISFISETGQMEFFIFASTKSPKKV